MDALKISLKLFVPVTLLLTLGAPARAQTSTLVPYVPIEGALNGDAQSWTFSGRTGEPLSFMVEAISGDLDPVLTISDQTGNRLITNDDYNYPDSRDSLLEAITIPELGTYTATVSAFGETSGDFKLTMQPGYGSLGYEDTFDTSNWSPVDAATSVSQNESFTLNLQQDHLIGTAVDNSADALDDFHAEVSLSNVIGSNWVVGITARQQGANNYYLFGVNHRGEWRFSVHTPDGDRVIRDWLRHPAIRAGETRFTLRLMAAGSSFDFFYNNNIVGRISDSTLTEPGRVGLAVGTTSIASVTSAQFDDLIVTVPVQINGAGVTAQQLMIADGLWMVQELQRRRLIPGEGDMVLNVAESFAEYARPGVNVLPLASGSTFNNLVLGATVYPDITADTATGCGLVFRSEDATHYTLAYVDGTGAYGLSQRNGETFGPGIYGENPLLASRDSHHLLVIANGNTLLYYIDGNYAGTLDNPAVDGSIGEAVVNFEPLYSSCHFVNTWLWRWD
jgi:hypothetical protein